MFPWARCSDVNVLQGYLKTRTTTMEQFEFYFKLWLKYKDIKSVMDRRHGFRISEQHLQRKLSARGHVRRKAYSDLAILFKFISNQLQYSRQLHGYRWIYAKCRENGLRVRKKSVCLVLKELNPRGLSLKQAGHLRLRNYFSKGPNRSGTWTHRINWSMN